MAHFAFENLSFAYPANEKQAITNVSLKIGKGEYIVLCGKSGSGKTTLLRHMKSVLTPQGKRSGRVLFCDRPLEEADLRSQSSRIGYVMQDPDAQIVTDKVWHELAFGLESLGVDKETMRARVAEMASYFGIESWFDKNVDELSGGQKQLLNLASIMAMQPEAIVLDEPTSQLDPIAAADFLNTVRKINLELGTTVVLSEHRLEEVFPCADRVVVMENGQISAEAAPIELGAILKEKGSDMLSVLPAPVRIFHEVGVKGECPLTVREGRAWLHNIVGEKEIKADEDTAYAEPDMPKLELKEIWQRYEKNSPDVLKGVDIKVEKNTLHAVVGGNGTGKSTVLKVICGVIRPYRGKIIIDGKKTDRPLEKGVAMLPQDPKSLFVKKSVREELEEMISKEDKADSQKIINEISETCEITEVLSTHPYDLSGGEQQRAALAKVLLLKPEILLLDEPTKGIDGFFKEKLAGIINKLKESGVTVIMVSHDVEFCARYADAVSMLFDGTVMTTNTPKRFFGQNSFYTTASSRMSRHVFKNAVTDEDVISAVKSVLEEE